MNPIGSPHQIRGQMNRSDLSPVFVHVIAHPFNQERNFFGYGWLMLAVGNCYRNGAISPGLFNDIFDRQAIQFEDARGSKEEMPPC